MAAGVRMRAEAERELRAGIAQVYAWNTTLPEALSAFPMLSSAQELQPGRYRLALAELAMFGFRAGITTTVEVSSEPCRTIRFVSVPGEGNAEVDVRMTLSQTTVGTLVHVAVSAVAHLEVPRVVPRRLVEASAAATLGIAVQRMLRSVELGVQERQSQARAALDEAATPVVRGAIR